jgi:hypothetical protein
LNEDVRSVLLLTASCEQLYISDIADILPGHPVISSLKVMKQSVILGILRKGFWQKLQKFGIYGKCLDIIRNMHKNIKSCVRSQKRFSDFFPCLTGQTRRKVMKQSVILGILPLSLSMFNFILLI